MDDLDNLISEAYEKDSIWEMTNLKPVETGLPVIVYVSDKGNHQHGPRIKVQNDYSTKCTNNWFSVLISANPDIPSSQKHIKLNVKSKDIEQVKQWIRLNKQALLDYWTGQITTTELCSKLRRL